MSTGSPSSKIKIAVTILIAIILLGISGYIVFEGFRFLDALYMTIITISTVGLVRFIN